MSHAEQPKRPWSPRYPMDINERFWSKVDADGDCWEWTATCNRKGYGNFYVRKDGKRTTARAHRFAWESLVGPISEGMVLDHLCRNRRCVNPDHLRPVTLRTNVIENVHGVGWQVNTAKTHCPAGHPYDDANTYTYPTGSGGVRRHCRTCIHERTRRVRAAAMARA